MIESDIPQIDAARSCIAYAERRVRDCHDAFCDRTVATVRRKLDEWLDDRSTIRAVRRALLEAVTHAVCIDRGLVRARASLPEADETDERESGPNLWKTAEGHAHGKTAPPAIAAAMRMLLPAPQR